jgi:hypothetical protein
MLNPEGLRIDTLASCVVIASRWPEFVEALLAAPEFLLKLRQVYAARQKIVQTQSESSDDPAKKDAAIRATQAELDALLADLRLKQFSGSADLEKLVAGITNPELVKLPRYFQMAQVVR